MQIEVSSETIQLLEAAMAAGRFASMDECIASLAKRARNGHMPRPSVDQLATEQDVGPIGDFRKLKADFWPDNESVDEFLQAIQSRRPTSDEPRAR